MAAANYLAGKSASVSVAGTLYRFKKWKLDMKAGVLNVTNFQSGGYREVVPGIIEASLELEGPYDGGNMPLTVGTSYAFTLTYSGAINILVTAMVAKIAPDVDVEKEEIIHVTAEVSGTFTAAIT